VTHRGIIKATNTVDGSILGYVSKSFVNVGQIPYTDISNALIVSFQTIDSISPATQLNLVTEVVSDFLQSRASLLTSFALRIRTSQPTASWDLSRVVTAQAMIWPQDPLSKSSRQTSPLVGLICAPNSYLYLAATGQSMSAFLAS
jgi:hypothetical protein